MSRTGAEASVVLMSGCFTQRGMPAMLDKRLRARAASECGADLVIELPFVYAAGGADMFALGAIRRLDGLGIVDNLSFGSESGDIDALSRVAAIFAEDSKQLNDAIKDGMKRGASYPAARERAVRSLLGEEPAELMKDPNNILAIEYIKEIMKTRSAIAPVTVKREAAGMLDVNQGARIAGATAIRTMFTNGEYPREYLPEATTRAIDERLGTGGRLVLPDDLFPHLVRTIASEQLTKAASGDSGDERLADILSATEGLENRLISAVHRARNMDEAVRFTKTRRYTETRVRRLILHTIIGLTKRAAAAATAEPAYARVLAFTEQGAKLIRRAKRKARIAVITNANRETPPLEPSKLTFAYDVKAANLHHLMEYGNIANFKEQSIKPHALSAIRVSNDFIIK
jgi:predicted nucleotidyltransferase